MSKNIKRENASRRTSARTRPTKLRAIEVRIGVFPETGRAATTASSILDALPPEQRDKLIPCEPDLVGCCLFSSTMGARRDGKLSAALVKAAKKLKQDYIGFHEPGTAREIWYWQDPWIAKQQDAGKLPEEFDVIPGREEFIERFIAEYGGEA